jgi:hypothetical protein
MEIGFQIGINVVFGVICAIIANGRGRSAVGWFFIGFFLSCIGLVILLVIPDLAKEQFERSRRDAETRRLREQLRADRQLGDQRYDEVHKRLGVHDKALGVDTAPPPPSALGGAATGSQYAAAPWYFDGGEGRRMGPLPFDDLRAAWRRSEVGPETFVWTEGMADWKRVRELPGMTHDLAS